MTTQPTSSHVESAYSLAKERYAALGVDTEQALAILRRTPVSINCWQGDDVIGFENPKQAVIGGIMATGNYPGRARNVAELRSDLDLAFSLLPGTHRLNLQANYLETHGQDVPRSQIEPRHFADWVDWAKANNHGLDLNPTLFSHPLVEEGFTLAHPDPTIRQFWVDHCIACRHIGAYFGEELGTPCVTNIWIPDGYKDTPVDRNSPRLRLRDSLDQIFAVPVDPKLNLDAVESKLFGLGLESYTVGSHEFYTAYAVANQIGICLDSGHFHPTETIGDKISALLAFVPHIMLHISRGVRWDSDHVVTLADDLEVLMQEIVRGGFLDRVNIGVDFFDASINRIAAWVIGGRNVQRALLMALLEPIDQLRQLESSRDLTGRFVFLEELKGLPFGAVWDYFCLTQEVPVGAAYVDEIRGYEKRVLANRK